MFPQEKCLEKYRLELFRTILKINLINLKINSGAACKQMEWICLAATQINSLCLARRDLGWLRKSQSQHVYGAIACETRAKVFLLCESRVEIWERGAEMEALNAHCLSTSKWEESTTLHKERIAAGKWQVIPVLMAERQVNRQYKGRAFS